MAGEGTCVGVAQTASCCVTLRCRGGDRRMKGCATLIHDCPAACRGVGRWVVRPPGRPAQRSTFRVTSGTVTLNADQARGDTGVESTDRVINVGVPSTAYRNASDCLEPSPLQWMHSLCCSWWSFRCGGAATQHGRHRAGSSARRRVVRRKPSTLLAGVGLR